MNERNTRDKAAMKVASVRYGICGVANMISLKITPYFDVCITEVPRTSYARMISFILKKIQQSDSSLNSGGDGGLRRYALRARSARVFLSSHLLHNPHCSTAAVYIARKSCQLLNCTEGGTAAPFVGLCAMLPAYVAQTRLRIPTVSNYYYRTDVQQHD